MKPISEQYHLRLPSPLNYAAMQSGQTTNPSGKEMGLDANHQQQVSTEGRGENFFLDILFHRMSAENVNMSGNPIKMKYKGYFHSNGIALGELWDDVFDRGETLGGRQVCRSLVEELRNHR